MINDVFECNIIAIYCIICCNVLHFKLQYTLQNTAINCIKHNNILSYILRYMALEKDKQKHIFLSFVIAMWIAI